MMNGKNPSFLNNRKQQFCALLGMVSLLFWTMYHVSLQPACNLIRQYRDLQSVVAKAEGAQQQIRGYLDQLARMAGTVRLFRDDTFFFEEVSRRCRAYNLLIRSFPEASRTKKGEYNVVIRQLEVEGDFRDMVRLVYEIEQTARLGTIGHMKYYLYRDRIQKREVLRCSILVLYLEHLA